MQQMKRPVEATKARAGVLISRAVALEDYSQARFRVRDMLRSRVMEEEALVKVVQAAQAGVAAGCGCVAAALSNPRLMRRCPSAFPSPVSPLSDPPLHDVWVVRLAVLFGPTFVNA
jgi:hypothetical protein